MSLNYKSFYENIIKNRLISNGDRVLCGLSGGKDSVSLIRLLNMLKSDIDFDLTAIHINHSLRDKESDRDELFSKELCNSLGVDFCSFKVNVKEFSESNKKGTEESARILRYGKFNEFAEKNSFNKIAVAHTLSDQVETVLFHIIRGTGLAGLSGMKPVNGKIIRPLLPFSSDEIQEFLKTNDFGFIFDSSNSDNKYTRNKIRNEIIPLLESINPNIEKSILRISENSLNANNFIENFAKKEFSPGLNSCDLDKLLKYSSNPDYLAPIYSVLNTICSNFEITLNFERFLSVIDLINSNRRDKIIQIEKGFVFRIKKDKLVLEKPEKYENYDISPVKLQIGENISDSFDLLLNISISENSNITKINKKLLNIPISSCKIVGDMFLRFPQKNDVIKMNSMSKNIFKMFSNLKIPHELRCKIPVICDSEEIIWLPFFGLCDKCRPKSGDEIFLFSLSGKYLNIIKEYI